MGLSLDNILKLIQIGAKAEKMAKAVKSTKTAGVPKVSKTSDEEKWILDNYGLSLNPNDPNYYGKIYADMYDTTMLGAQNRLDTSNLTAQQIYGQNVNQAKLTQDMNIKAYEQDYFDKSVQANNQLKQMQAVYGDNQNRLAQMGLTGSGYDAYIKGKAYGEYQDAVSNAYNALQAGKMNAQRIYGAEQMNAQNQLNQAKMLMEQIYGDTQLQAQKARDAGIRDAYQKLKDEYRTKQQSYMANYSALEYDLNNGETDINMAKLMLDNDQITKQQYDTYVVKARATNYENLRRAYNNVINGQFTTENDRAEAIRTVLANADTAFEDGNISKEHYSDIYANDYLTAITEMTIDDYENVKTNLEAEKDKLGGRYQEVKSELNKKYKELWTDIINSADNLYTTTNLKTQLKYETVFTKEERNKLMKEIEAKEDKIRGVMSYKKPEERSVGEVLQYAGDKAAVGKIVSDFLFKRKR